MGWSVIEGFGGAIMFPIIASLLMSTYTGKERAFGLAIFGAMTAIGVAAGPIIGGSLATYASWRWAFGLEAVIVIFVINMVGRNH